MKGRVADEHRTASPHCGSRNAFHADTGASRARPGDVAPNGRTPRIAAQPPPARDGFDRRLFIDTIAVLAMIAVPAVLLAAALLHRPLILVALALAAPTLLAVPVALEHRHARNHPLPGRRAGRDRLR